MKTLTSLLFLFCALTLWSQSSQKPEPVSQGNQETRTLHKLLKMPEQELSALRLTIERIEAMDPEEKERMRGRIGKLDQLPPERLNALRERFKAIDPETRAAMRKRWMEMAPELQRDWRDRLRDMTPEERAEVFDEQGFLPAPGKRPSGPKPPKTKSE
jgi:hypothetical protein